MYKYPPKTVIIQHKEKYVIGYSFKLDKVYKTRNPAEAKKFTAEKAQEFILEHANKGRSFDIENISIHVLKPGQKFDPYKEQQ